jgi:hypothetical protein
MTRIVKEAIQEIQNQMITTLVMRIIQWVWDKGRREGEGRTREDRR